MFQLSFTSLYTVMKAKVINRSIHHLLNKWNGDKTNYNLSSYQGVLREIQNKTFLLKDKSDTDLKKYTKNLKNAASGDKSLSDLLPEVFALVKETFKRKMNISPYEVQLIGAIAIHEGNIIEMKTGEGKTLTAVFPAVLNALTGKGVHILTYNDYLAKRDAEWMRPVYEFFGLSVSSVANTMNSKEKRKAYRADITYGTVKEVGFDYLRSCMAYEEKELLIREFNLAIVDEADALLIDEASNPLVLAGVLEKSALDHYEVARFVEGLVSGQDFILDEYSRNVNLTDSGIEKAENHYGLDNLFQDTQQLLHSSINLALQARVLLNKDIDYVIKDGKIKLVDELTGRVIEDRKWQNGLQTAVEAKEQLPIHSEGSMLRTISIQHLMSLYPKLAGMTGTAQEASAEFSAFYNLGVVVIPPNEPCRRIDYEDRVYPTKEAKLEALIQEIKAVHLTGRPILIGTFTVKESEHLHEKLIENGLRCRVLNANNDEFEAEIISNAGEISAITISTNMAGRGTDILLGGNDENEREKVKQLGGLHIIGTNRHESKRIDQQLRGRAGRQGDPGSTRFIISLEDDLMVKYKLKELLPKRLRNIDQPTALQHPIVNRSISQAQRIISGQLFELRHTLFNYSSFVEKQRIYMDQMRQEVLNGNIKPISSGENERCNRQKEYILHQYDIHWALHLEFIARLKEGIYWERIGGNDPLQVFFKKADGHFQQIMTTIAYNIRHMPVVTEVGEDLSSQRPSSTWTYVVNDNPFKNQIGLFLGNNSNIGFQVDGLSAAMLLIVGIIRKFRKTP
jgi:preprotein translocase subunit SecA